VFLEPRADLSCMVRGHLTVGTESARLNCRLDAELRRGSTSELELDLSPGWVPDDVQIQGLDDPVTWHASAPASGETRLPVMLPASVLAEGEWTLTLGAGSAVPGGSGPLNLPRVRPVRAATLDEAWLAWVDEGTTIRPTAARGLAWIDPGDVTGLRDP